MSIDLKRNKDSLLAAWKEVVDDNKNTNWAVYGYEGQTKVLKVVEKGEDGIEEMVDELNSGKIMYAFCRVTDPNTNLPKYVLINWQGEGVPEMKKGAYASHFRDVMDFFRGHNVTIHARSEDDVEEESILKLVAKSSGANYSFHKEQAKPVPVAEPVGSVYKKTNAAAAINLQKRDKFWEKAEQDEKNRIVEEKKKAAEERKKIETERKEREAREAKERDQRVQQHMKEVQAAKIAERRASESSSEKDEEKKRWEQEQKDAEQDYDERRTRSESLRKERAAEAASLVSQRGNNPRAVFEQGTSASRFEKKVGPPPPRKIKHSFGQQQQEPPRKPPIQLPTEEPVRDDVPLRPPAKKELPQLPKQQPPREPSPEPVREPSPEPVREPSPEPVREPSPEPVREPSPEPPPARPISATTTELPKTRNLLAEGLPKRQDSDEEEEDQDWNEDTTEDMSSPLPVPQIQQQAPAEPAAPAVSGQDMESLAGKGMCATALYDYQAEDESEITFDPGDIITNIEQIDEGWWRGTAPNGKFGMFPANYVELINQETDIDQSDQPEPEQSQTSNEAGLSAKALYDYQASDDTEITFDPDDIITNIEQIDEGWWRGTAPDGKFGMFPANYVELI